MSDELVKLYGKNAWARIFNGKRYEIYKIFSPYYENDAKREVQELKASGNLVRMIKHIPKREKIDPLLRTLGVIEQKRLPHFLIYIHKK
jgi:hypothetical protein